MRMCMADTDNSVTSIHVDVLNPMFIPYVRILCFYNSDIIERIDVEKFHDCWYKLFAIFDDNLIPLISAELKPWCSISLSPAMVHPFGEVTLSISSSGCVLFAISNLAAPKAVCAAIFSASC